MDHKRDSGKERKLLEYSWDYCFPGDELGFRWTVLVGVKRGSIYMATAIPLKGGGDKFVVDKCIEFIDGLGDRQNSIIVQSHK